jgi:hypothetical protein
MDWDTWKAMRASEEIEAADWIGQRLHPFSRYDVGSVIPSGFEAYARIFHPASRHSRAEETEVSWSEVAAWNGKTVHPEMQFHSIAAPASGREVGPQPWNGEPRLGVLSDPQIKALIGLLERHTSTPDDCWFCLWEGYGYLNAGAWVELRAYSGPLRHIRSWLRRFQLRLPKRPPTMPARRRVELPHRGYLLFKGPIVDALGHRDGPNLWWPDDRAWCVASEIDFPYTYVGGPSQLIQDILAHPAIEALPSGIDHGTTADSDKIN